MPGPFLQLCINILSFFVSTKTEQPTPLQCCFLASICFCAPSFTLLLRQVCRIFFDFKLPGHSMALTRIALAACILSSKKQQDGISRIIYKSDLEKLKGKASTKQLDEMLCSLWAEVQHVNLPLGYVCFGKACVRMILHTLGKEKVAKE